MFIIICQLLGLLGMLACLGFVTLAMNRNRKSRQFVRRVFRRIEQDR